MIEIYKKAMDGPWKTVGDGLQYKIEMKDTVLHLYFQYTASDKDWAYNFDFIPTFWKGIPLLSRLLTTGSIKPYKNMPHVWRAHRGFVSLYKSGRDEVFEDIKNYSFTSIIISGISQGAALSVLAHEDLTFNHPTLDIKTFAFAGPRVFWFPPKELKERLKNVTHITRRGDIVTLVPPYIFGFSHCYKKIKIGDFKFPWWTHHRFEEYVKFLGNV